MKEENSNKVNLARYFTGGRVAGLCLVISRGLAGWRGWAPAELTRFYFGPLQHPPEAPSRPELFNKFPLPVQKHSIFPAFLS